MHQLKFEKFGLFFLTQAHPYTPSHSLCRRRRRRTKVRRRWRESSPQNKQGKRAYLSNAHPKPFWGQQRNSSRGESPNCFLTQLSWVGWMGGWVHLHIHAPLSKAGPDLLLSFCLALFSLLRPTGYKVTKHEPRDDWDQEGGKIVTDVTHRGKFFRLFPSSCLEGSRTPPLWSGIWREEVSSWTRVAHSSTHFFSPRGSRSRSLKVVVVLLLLGVVVADILWEKRRRDIYRRD